MRGNRPWGSSARGFRQSFTWLVLIGLVLPGLLSACSPSGEQAVAVGDPAPDFTLPAASGEQVALADFRGSKPVLLYFHMADG